MGFAFEITNEDISTAADQLGVALTDTGADYFADQIDADEVEENALRGEDMDEQTQYAIQDIKDQLADLPEFQELLNMDAVIAKNIVDDVLSEYLSDNKDADYEDFDDIVIILQSYCEDYISSDEFQKAQIDQAVRLLRQTEI